MTCLHIFFILLNGYNFVVQTYMDSEIRAIMAQYMPLDNQGEVEVHGTHHGNV